MASCDNASTNFASWIEVPIFDNKSTIIINHADAYTKQVSYKMNKEFPATNIFEFYNQMYINNGWTRCGHYPEGWIDRSEFKKASEFQRTSYYVNLKKKLIGILIMNYDINININLNLRNINIPDNNKLFVTILQNKYKNINKELASLKINCPKKKIKKVDIL